MKKKLFAVLVLGAVMAAPAYAVFNEKNISQTISVLRHELHLAWTEIQEQEIRNEKATQMSEVQHKDLINTIKWINELTLILYSQEKGFSLDQTYAVEGVMYEYEQLNKRRSPQFTDINKIAAETERYQRLIEALRLLPPSLKAIREVPDTLRQEMSKSNKELGDLNSILGNLMSPELQGKMISEPAVEDSLQTKKKSGNLLLELAMAGINSRKEAADTSESTSYMLPPEAQADRDSCIAYAKEIIKSYGRQKDRIEKDDRYFTEMRNRLQQTYEYSKARFEDMKKYIFVTGQENYFFVLANLRKYASDAYNDLEQNYSLGETEQDKDGLRQSQWRGIMLAGTILYSIMQIAVIALFVILLFCVILKNVKPFNTEWFKRTKTVTVLLAIAVIYYLVLGIGAMFPMSNAMLAATYIILEYLWILIAFLLSILVSMKQEDATNGLRCFLPVLVLAFIIMFFRAIFLPDKMIHLLLSPILLIFFIWQIRVIRKFKEKIKEYKVLNVLQYVTAVILVLALIASLEGYSLLALMFTIWWIFQVASVATLASIAFILKSYERKFIFKKKEKYAIEHKMISSKEDGDFIRVTWLFDFIYRAVLPSVGVLSILGCIYLAMSVFNLTGMCETIFHKTFFDFTDTDGKPILQISLYILVSLVANFFIYRYLYYLARSIYRTLKLEQIMEKSGKELLLKNDVNLTLAYNVIGIIIWGMFVVYSIHSLKIPVGAISVVAAGLATGIGFALKDVLNNFIYGIQLMSGRLKVGDMVECDGIRGSVEKISYQSTEIHTISGGVISFTNSTLFNKNFQNLTKNSPYEFLSVIVSVSYGEDVGKVRTLILDALNDFTHKKDKYGRKLIEKDSGIWITLDSFGDSSVNLAIKQMVLVESRNSYAAEVKERVYKLFNDNGIVIPFPQQEVSILNFPKK